MAALILNDQRIQKVLPLLLREENREDYIPKVVSVGPYHHGKPELSSVEAFKPIAVQLFLLEGRENLELYYNNVFVMIAEIRNCYEQQSTANYSDADLARMMLFDTCFVIIHMETSAPPETNLPDPLKLHKFYTMAKHLGMLTMAIVLRDLFLLENQIPLRVVKLLMDLRYEAGEYEKLRDRYITTSIFGAYRPTIRPPPKEPLHLLEAFHSVVISDCVDAKKSCLCFICRWLCCFKVEEEIGAAPATGAGTTRPSGAALGAAGAGPSKYYWTCRWLGCARVKKETSVDLEIGLDPRTSGDPETNRFLKFLTCKLMGAAKKNKARRIDIRKYLHSFRSVTDLKAKGIYFKPSPTQSLREAKFKSKFFYANLELPEWAVSIYTKVFFLNMIAYEISPNNPTRCEVTSYINFMKSLIEKPEDVKELREKKIIYNMLGSDEEVLNVYKDINTYGANNPHIFQKVKDKIQAHYNSEIKTWMAELIHTHFRTPWTIIAFLVAIALLAITSAQLYYSVHRKSK